MFRRHLHLISFHSVCKYLRAMLHRIAFGADPAPGGSGLPESIVLVFALLAGEFLSVSA
jgi:hypothetical protein